MCKSPLMESLIRPAPLQPQPTSPQRRGSESSESLGIPETAIPGPDTSQETPWLIDGGLLVVLLVVVVGMVGRVPKLDRRPSSPFLMVKRAISCSTTCSTTCSPVTI